MANLLNTIIANQSLKPAQRDEIPALTLDTKGNVKPMDDKGKLLPSKIFGSPIEYAKDLKQDIVNIGRAAKGEANDHELGRINDVAMKLGSLGLATYLFVKNPLKMNKLMEFVGFGTFFGSMALWPKLAIQLPIKLRTGVDVHQKYIDSQNRKKMLFQDPQYDLTDLYSRKDLDEMGKKLKVSENLPDRDNFIKQRAKKTATQANTLWMLSSFSAPIMSALACNRLEKPIQNGLEKFDILTSAIQLDRGASTGIFAKAKQSMAERTLNKFIAKNSDKVLDDKLISELASKLGLKANSASLQDAIKEELKLLKNNIKIDESFIRKTLADKVPDSVFASLTDKQRELLNKAIESGSLKNVAEILAPLTASTKKEQVQLSKTFTKILESAKKSAETPKLSQVADRVRTLYSGVSKFAADKSILDKYITARVGDKSGTYIANQWGKVGDKLVKALKLSTKELKLISNGDMSVLTDKIAKLASNEVEYDKAIKELMELITDYEAKTSSTFTDKVKQKAQDICMEASSLLQADGFTNVARKLTNPSQKGTVENIINVNATERITGAQSSFYRLIQSLELFKKIKEGKLDQQIAKILKEEGQKVDQPTIKKLAEACKSIVLTATTTDYIEKLKSAGFELSESEYKTVMRTLFENDTEAISSLQQSLERTVGAGRAKEMVAGFKKYKDNFLTKIADWKNTITQDLAKCTITKEGTSCANAVEKNNLAGKPVDSMIKDIAKQTYNSRKWLQIFGISMAVIATATLAIGLTFGKKTKMEKQVEEESKVNG